MNYSTALHPIKNFAKTLPELINEEAAAGMETSSPDLVLADTTRHDQTQPDTTRHNQTQPDTTRHNQTRPDTTRHDQTKPNFETNI